MFEDEEGTKSKWESESPVAAPWQDIVSRPRRQVSIHDDYDMDGSGSGFMPRELHMPLWFLFLYLFVYEIILIAGGSGEVKIAKVYSNVVNSDRKETGSGRHFKKQFLVVGRKCGLRKLSDGRREESECRIDGVMLLIRKKNEEYTS